MAEPTLEEIMKRLEAVEKQLAAQAAEPVRKKDWRRVIGNTKDAEFALLVQTEIDAAREADRRAAQQEQPE